MEMWLYHQAFVFDKVGRLIALTLDCQSTGWTESSPSSNAEIQDIDPFCRQFHVYLIQCDTNNT